VISYLATPEFWEEYLRAEDNLHDWMAYLLDDDVVVQPKLSPWAFR